MKKAVLFMIRFYQRNISVLYPYRRCKYLPTCSDYARDAIENNGVIIGIALGLWRILRCNPFSRGGYDPAPCLHTCFHKGGTST